MSRQKRSNGASSSLNASSCGTSHTQQVSPCPFLRPEPQGNLGVIMNGSALKEQR